MLLSPTTKNRIQGRGWGGELTLRRFGEKGEGGFGRRGRKREERRGGGQRKGD